MFNKVEVYQTSMDRHLPSTAIRLVEFVFMRPVINAKIARQVLGVTFPAAQKAIALLVEQGILAEITGARRNKAYAAEEVIKVLEEEISPSRRQVMPVSR